MSIIQSIQQVTITIANLSASNTATINPVNTANAAAFLGGRSTGYTLNVASNIAVGVTLTNATTVTATRTSTGGALTVVVSIVEFTTAVVNSVQYGTVSISSSTSGTTTLGTAVGSNSFVIYNGVTGGATGLSTTEGAVSLNQGTHVVTGSIASSSTATVYFCVVDLTSTAIASVQQASFSGALSTALTKTATITSVTTADTILVSGGLGSVNGSVFEDTAFTAQLTASNTVTFTRAVGTSVSANLLLVTAVQFQSGVLTANAVQRGTTTISSSATSNTSGITTVNTSFAFCNYCGFLGGNSATNINANELLTTTALTNATTETSTLNTSGIGTTSSWEVVEFASATTWTGTSTWPGVGTLVEGNESQIDVASATLGGVGTLVEAHETAIQSALATLGGVGTINASAVQPGANATLPGVGTLVEGGESQIDAAFATLGGLGSFAAIAVPGAVVVSGGAADEVDPQTDRRRRWLAEHDRELPRVRVVRESKPQVERESEKQEAPQTHTKPEVPQSIDPVAAKLPATPFITPALSLLSSPAVGLIRAIKGRDNPPDAVSATPLPPPPPPTFSLRLSAIAAERAAQRQRDDEDDVAAVLGMM